MTGEAKQEPCADVSGGVLAGMLSCPLWRLLTLCDAALWLAASVPTVLPELLTCPLLTRPTLPALKLATQLLARFSIPPCQQYLSRRVYRLPMQRPVQFSVTCRTYAGR
jgi:hypothetical protein